MDPKTKKDIEEIIELFERTDLNEIEVEKEGLKIRLRKDPPSVITASPGYTKIIEEKTAVTEGSKEKKKEEESKTEENLVPIKTPMVGSFYRSPAPDAEPFVEVGDTVEPEQVVCIIEAMKLMNEIKSEIKGRIVKILVEDGHPVEYGQVLFLVQPE